MTGFDYEQWLGVARRHSRKRDEAGDLLQEAIVAGLRAGRSSFGENADAKWLAGAIRKIAVMRARTEARRKNRDARATTDRSVSALSSSVPHAFLDSLTDGTRKVATLVAAGMNGAEIMSILELSPAAFRQRLTSIRKAWRKTCLALDESDGSPTLSIGIIRRALLGVIRERGGIGAYDPDGHLMIFTDSSSQKRNPRQH